ncbi:MAG: cobyrinic acid a,c-diamide synthase [Desulfobacterales bacterium]|nr:MAG: cobyrinic acid a,c-diamide synthase [Desulfobacterales bacterium]
MPDRGKRIAGLIVAGLRGGAGKTVVSLGIARAWTQGNYHVSVFKKGPDYIDAGWLSQAAGRPCYNLDTFMCHPSTVQNSFFRHSAGSDIAVVEGNRGLYDGLDYQGSTSTAELAKLLGLPVLLVVDCTKSTRTIAALVMGCSCFDPDVRICGVVLNYLAGNRHENIIRKSIETSCQIPVLGAIPRFSEKDFPERHMGLVTADEHSSPDHSIDLAADIVNQYLDLPRLYNSCIPGKTTLSPPVPQADDPWDSQNSIDCQDKVRIGILHDSAFSFYYQENLNALEANGAELLFISPLDHRFIPQVHALYIGGGFPETHASRLSENQTFRQQLKALSRKGLPIYAECGGLIFLGKELVLDQKIYPMTDIFPITFGLAKKPQGCGYTIARVVNDTPFYQKGDIVKGHEFRYSTVLHMDYTQKDMGFQMEKGTGIIDHKDGFSIDNTFGTYTHVHALGTPQWASSLTARARAYKHSHQN